MRRLRSDLACALALFLAGAALFAFQKPWQRPVLLDAATWDYMAVETARGLVPYRDVFLHKTPGAALLGAVGARAGTALGIDPILAAHAVFLFLGALAPVLLYGICRHRCSRGASLAAGFALLAYHQWTIAALEGCRPKVATVAFGLGALLAAERRSPKLASLLAGTSVLFWQPGLAFLAGAWASLLAAGRPTLGAFAGWAAWAAAPAAGLLAWLAVHDALGDFFDQAVWFNFAYIHNKARTPAETLLALAATLADWNAALLAAAPAAVAGWLAARPVLPRSLGVSGAIYAAMTFVSYQSWPDSILLAPVAASVLGIGVVALLATRLREAVAAGLAIVLFFAVALPDWRPKFRPPLTLDAQRAKVQALAAPLREEDVVVGVSVPEFFLLSGRRNGWKWPYLWFGVDTFAASRHPKGFGGILADLERLDPEMILVARLWSGPERVMFEDWAATRFRRESARLYPHIRRPIQVYRRAGDIAPPAAPSR